MDSEQMRLLLRQKPFQPFRVVLTDGRAFEVRYPEMNLLARSFMKIGIPESGGKSPICDHTEYVPFSLIARVDALPRLASEENSA